MYLHEKDYYEFVSFLQGNQHIKTVGKKINTKKKKKKNKRTKGRHFNYKNWSLWCIGQMLLNILWTFLLMSFKKRYKISTVESK